MNEAAAKEWFKRYLPMVVGPLRVVRYLPLRIREKLFKSSVFMDTCELDSASLLPVQMLDEVVRCLKPKSALDLGCGVGRALDYFLAKGIDAVGVEGSAMAISRAKHPEKIKKFNLNRELNLARQFDLVWSFEFVEHIHPDYVPNLLKTFSNHSNRIVISAAQPGQGGSGHFNEQPAAYWIEKFKVYGFQVDETLTERLHAINECFSQNMIVFFR